jgi:phosphomannomutase
MTLIASVSGIRGTIGGKPGNNLTPIDIVAFASAYARWISKNQNSKIKVVLGRDARPSGAMVRNLVAQTLCAAGIDVLDCGLATTPTVEMEVVRQKANGGVILTASHNPENWNALKLLNHRGEFLSVEDGAEILQYVQEGGGEFAEVQKLGKITKVDDALEAHIQAILDMPEIDADKIASKNFSVVVDGINSVGALAIPKLLGALGVKNVHVENAEMHGFFAHNPEPLRQHLGATMQIVKDKSADMGIIVDPDVDRLAFIDETGEMFGEEYTLVAAADFWLRKHPGVVVSNMSSSRALDDLAKSFEQKRYTSAVGEVHVVKKMKEVGAVLGGEGNGGVILPALHYGRDALVGVAMVLTHMAETGKSLTELRAGYAHYEMSKNKVELLETTNPDQILEKLKQKYSDQEVEDIDGLKINFANGWVHMRKSNTEPIIRIYSEAPTQKELDDLAASFIEEIRAMV